MTTQQFPRHDNPVPLRRTPGTAITDDALNNRARDNNTARLVRRTDSTTGRTEIVAWFALAFGVINFGILAYWSWKIIATAAAIREALQGLGQ